MMLRRAYPAPVWMTAERQFVILWGEWTAIQQDGNKIRLNGVVVFSRMPTVESDGDSL